MDLVNGPLSRQNSVNGLVSTCFFLICVCLCVCSTLRQRADPVYSPPLQISGLCWRLKVYPVRDIPVHDAGTLAAHRSCLGLLHTVKLQKLSWKWYFVTAHRRVLRVRSATVTVQAGASSRSCAGFPLVARAIRNGCAVCRLHAPPSVQTCGLCCWKPSVAWLR